MTTRGRSRAADTETRDAIKAGAVLAEFLGEQLRAAESEANRYRQVYTWLEKNNPSALHSCPYKLRALSSGDSGALPDSPAAPPEEEK